MFGILVILFTVVPALELFLLFKIGAQIGGFNTFMIVILTGVLGAALAKSQGLTILMKVQQEMQRGELPGNQIIQGFMVFGGGLLLLTPGFMTDILGFAMVLPGTRHLLMMWIKKLIERGVRNGDVYFRSFGTGSGGGFYSYTYNSHKQNQNDTHAFGGHPRPGSQIDSDTFEAEYHKKD